MTKKQMIEIVAKNADISQKAAGVALETIFESIKKEVKKGNSVTVSKFGTFKLAKRAARDGRNPQTGKPMKIKASKALSFKQSSTVKAEFN